MNFRDEYKKEITDAMPDEQAMERIRRGVAEKLAAAPKRKPFPVRIAAVCCSAAACLVIGGAAITLITNKPNLDNFIGLSGGANSMSGAPNKDLSDNVFNGVESNDANGAGGSDMNNAEGGGADYGAGDDVTGGVGSIPAGGADNEPQSNFYEGAGDMNTVSEKTDSVTPVGGFADSPARATIEILDNGVILTINGTVTRFVKDSPSGEFQGALPGIADSEPGSTAAESVSDSVTGADNTSVDGTNGVSEDNNEGDAYGDSSAAGGLTEPTSPETNFVKVTADNGQTMFIQRDGDYLLLYSIDRELLGVFIEV